MEKSARPVFDRLKRPQEPTTLAEPIVPVNEVSTELLKIAGRLEEAGLEEPASRLTALAEKVSENDRLLTVAEAAKWLGCGRRTLDNLIATRRIPAFLIGGRYRIDKHQVLKETKLGS